MFGKIKKIFQTVSELNDKVGEGIHEFIDTAEAINKQAETFVTTNKDLPPEFAEHWKNEFAKLHKKSNEDSVKKNLLLEIF